MTSQITEFERDIDKARVTKDYASCSNLHCQQCKMIKELNSLKKRHADLQKKEIKHQKYMAKRSDEGKSKTSSSDYDDAVQKDIRNFLKSSSSIPYPNAEEKNHGPQSDDTLILSSDEENCGQTKDKDFTDRASVCSSMEDMGATQSFQRIVIFSFKRRKMALVLVKYKRIKK